MGASSLVACWATQRLSTPCWSDAYQVTSLPAGWMEVIIYRLCVNSKGAEVSPPKMIWDQHNAGTCQSHKNKVTRQRTRSQDKISKKNWRCNLLPFLTNFDASENLFHRILCLIHRRVLLVLHTGCRTDRRACLAPNPPGMAGSVRSSHWYQLENLDIQHQFQQQGVSRRPFVEPNFCRSFYRYGISYHSAVGWSFGKKWTKELGSPR